MIMPLLALLLLLALPAALIGGEVHIFRGRRVRWWRAYAFHFPTAADMVTPLKAGPLVADVGVISLHHVWHYVHSEGWNWLLPWRASWLMAEAGPAGILIRNQPSWFEAVNRLPPLWIPRERILWATVEPGSWLADALLSFDARGDFEPGKDPAFSLPLQLSIRLHFPSGHPVKAWVDLLQTMGIPVMGAEGVKP